MIIIIIIIIITTATTAIITISKYIKYYHIDSDWYQYHGECTTEITKGIAIKSQPQQKHPLRLEGNKINLTRKTSHTFNIFLQINFPAFSFVYIQCISKNYVLKNI